MEQFPFKEDKKRQKNQADQKADQVSPDFFAEVNMTKTGHDKEGKDQSDSFFSLLKHVFCFEGLCRISPVRLRYLHPSGGADQPF